MSDTIVAERRESDQRTARPRRRNGQRLARLAHSWLSMATMLVVLFFALTGLLLPLSTSLFSRPTACNTVSAGGCSVFNTGCGVLVGAKVAVGGGGGVAVGLGVALGTGVWVEAGLAEIATPSSTVKNAEAL